MAAYPHKLDASAITDNAKARWMQKQIEDWPGAEIRALKEMSPEILIALEALVDAINEANHHD